MTENVYGTVLARGGVVHAEFLLFGDLANKPFVKTGSENSVVTFCNSKLSLVS